MPPVNAVEPDSLILVGTCGPPHGVRGELKVIPETDDPDRLADLEALFLGPSPDRARARSVEGIRFQTTKRGVLALVSLAGVPDREAAEALRGLGVYAVESDLPALAEGEVFLHDLIGLGVVTEEGEDIGTVQDVLTGGAQRLLLVKRPGQPDVLVPDVDAIVTQIDLDTERITIRPPEGLLD